MQQVVQNTQEEKIINFEDKKILCYDVFKIQDVIEQNRFKFIYDIKLLYKLKNYKTDGLLELAQEILGENKTKKINLLFSKLQAQINSYKNTKINFTFFNVYDAFSKDLINNFYEERANIIVELFNEFKDKEILEYYEKVFYKFVCYIAEINKNELDVDLNNALKDCEKDISLIKKRVKENKIKININPLGAKDGRMSCGNGFVNLFGLKKEARRVLVAPNDFYFVQIDYKCFQPRIAISQVDDAKFIIKMENIDDIYSIFEGNREENKRNLLVWMFNDKPNEIIEKEVGQIRQFRKEIFEKVRINKKIKNIFDRVLYFNDEEERTVFKNYIDSIEVDILINVFCRIFEYLKENKYESKILFPFHDSIIFKINKKELDIIKKLCYIMKYETGIDSIFPVEIKVGKNLFDLKEMKL
jgi:hypothetical protein